MISIKKLKNKNNKKQLSLMKIRRFESSSSSLFSFFSMPHTLNTFDYIKKNLSKEYSEYEKHEALKEKIYESKWKQPFLDLPQRIRRHKYNYVKHQIYNNPLSILSNKGFIYYPEGFFYTPQDLEDFDNLNNTDREQSLKSWMDLFVLSNKFKHVYYNVTISSFLGDLIYETNWLKSEVFNFEKNKGATSFDFNDIEFCYQANENIYELDFSYHAGIGLHIRINNGKIEITKEEVEESLKHFLDNEDKFWLKQFKDAQLLKENNCLLPKKYTHLQNYLNDINKKSQLKITKFLKPLFKKNLKYLNNSNALNYINNDKMDYFLLSFNCHSFNYQHQVFEFFVKQEFEYILRKLENLDSEKLILEKNILTPEEYQVIFHQNGLGGLVAKSLQEEKEQMKLHKNGWDKIREHEDLKKISSQYDNITKILFDKNNAFFTDLTQKIYYSSIISAEHEGDNFKRLNNYQTISFFKELFYSLEENKIKEIVKPLLNNENLN